MPPLYDAVETPEPLTGAVFSSFSLPDAAGSVRLMLIGELDLVTAGRARVAIAGAQDGTRTLICDLGDVWFVDLSGLRVLLDATARANLTGDRFALANCPAIIPRMLALLNVEGALEVQPGAWSAAPDPGCAQIRRHVS